MMMTANWAGKGDAEDFFVSLLWSHNVAGRLYWHLNERKREKCNKAMRALKNVVSYLWLCSSSHQEVHQFKVIN